MKHEDFLKLEHGDFVRCLKDLYKVSGFYVYSPTFKKEGPLIKGSQKNIDFLMALNLAKENHKNNPNFGQQDFISYGILAKKHCHPSTEEQMISFKFIDYKV